MSCNYAVLYLRLTAFDQNRFPIIDVNNPSLCIVLDMKQQFVWVGEEMGNEQAKSEVATGFGIQSMDQHLQRKFSKGIQFNSEWKCVTISCIMEAEETGTLEAIHINRKTNINYAYISIK